MTRRLLLPPAASLSLALALTLLAAAPASADTLTGRTGACVEEAKESLDGCLFDGVRLHEPGFRRAWHNTRCRTAFAINAAACLPSGVIRAVTGRR